MILKDVSKERGEDSRLLRIGYFERDKAAGMLYRTLELSTDIGRAGLRLSLWLRQPRPFPDNPQGEHLIVLTRPEAESLVRSHENHVARGNDPFLEIIAKEPSCEGADAAIIPLPSSEDEPPTPVQAVV
jgi:hypothetical protein